MNKNILLAAAALSVLATAGAANAASITARAGAVSVTPSAPYTLARELNYSAGITSTAGQFDTVVTANTPLAAGTYTVTLSYSGATINAAVSTAAITQGTAAPTNTAVAGFETAAAGAATAATLTLSNGGSVGSNSVSYTLQIPAGGSVPALYFAPALRVTGPVSVTASITNQVTGQPVDPSVIQSLITTTTQGFAARAIADTTNSDIVAGGAAPYFRSLTDGALGTVNYAVASAAGTISTFLGASGTSAAAYKDLNGTTVLAADVTGGNIVVNGSMTNLTLSATGATSVTQSGDSASIVLPAAPTASAISIAATSATGAQLRPSAYTVSGSYTLASAFTGPLNFTTANLETVDTEGLTYVIPWVSSRTQGASTGSRTVIRVSRVGTDVTTGGNVFAQIVNPLRGTAAGSYSLIGTLPASGELVLSSDTLETAFGDFGRADIRMVVTPVSGNGFTNFTPGINDVIVKRVIAQPNGGVSEMDVVSVGAAGSAVPTVNF
ncbi:MAG: hypothetical protein VX561_13360 [Pseudomonadota bacterium]|nr:hypothetical protein [Pseudomonadota bacterium]